MNYIIHLNTFFAKAESEEWLTPYHQSLYLALFRMWNQAKFKNELKIYRDVMMAKAKIGSKKTYYACMKDLTAAGFIQYHPSKNRFESASVTMIPFHNTTQTPARVPDQVPQRSANDTLPVSHVGHILKQEYKTVTNQTVNYHEYNNIPQNDNNNNGSRRAGFYHEPF
ncbi:hypothetical protein [Chitinophaga rhizophila]|uniref:Transcriptional regulator n=1 Tax=Chitinophaga rhizophila TaxID=2866212 RepID=A0ABS7GKE6_9BACT|nr:hypothetical protein [Chitinophaga rhizophila]MBW8688173.1 hypothetical protein [Chitinophaga rhizophila]